jgi:hypothetical protein
MKNIDAHIQEIFAQSKSEGEIRIKMENLTSIIDFAKRNEAENGTAKNQADQKDQRQMADQKLDAKASHPRIVSPGPNARRETNHN